MYFDIIIIVVLFLFFTCVGLFVHVTVKYFIFAKKAIKLTQFISILILSVF